MTDTKAEVKIDLRAMKAVQRDIERGLKAGTGAFGDLLKQWAARYRSFVQERFVKLSRGGGEWPPLKTRVGSILRDTNTLFAALSPAFSGAPGALQQKIPFGIRVGFGGPGGHPGGPSVTEIARWHHEGAGFLPVREIIVTPPQRVVTAMRVDAERAVAKTIKDNKS